MSDSEEEPRDFREAAALLADMVLQVEAIVDRPGPNPMDSLRRHLDEVKVDLRRCGFTLVELHHFLYLYLGFSEAEMHAERQQYELLVRMAEDFRRGVE